MKTDSELCLDTERQLGFNPKLSKYDITVVVRNGVASLSGSVSNYAVKCEIIKQVKKTFGIIGIVDNLELALGGATSNDSDITKRVVQALEGNVFVPSETITPVVIDGWVTLKGTALYYYEKLDAKDAIRSLQGIRGITDSITIDNPEVVPDASDRIIDSIIQTTRIDPRRIMVNVSGKTATLNGSVRSLAERDQVEMLAWSTLGVSAVENHLEVRC